jgi:hypothetical protein
LLGSFEHILSAIIAFVSAFLAYTFAVSGNFCLYAVSHSQNSDLLLTHLFECFFLFHTRVSDTVCACDIKSKGAMSVPEGYSYVCETSDIPPNHIKCVMLKSRGSKLKKNKAPVQLYAESDDDVLNTNNVNNSNSNANSIYNPLISVATSAMITSSSEYSSGDESEDERPIIIVHCNKDSLAQISTNTLGGGFKFNSTGMVPGIGYGAGNGVIQVPLHSHRPNPISNNNSNSHFNTQHQSSSLSQSLSTSSSSLPSQTSTFERDVFAACALPSSPVGVPVLLKSSLPIPVQFQVSESDTLNNTNTNTVHQEAS